MSNQIKQNELEEKEVPQMPTIKFYSGQLLTIYTELHSILSDLEEKYRYSPDVSIHGDTPRRDFVSRRFYNISKICDSISSYLLSIEDYKDSMIDYLSECVNSSNVGDVGTH